MRSFFENSKRCKIIRQQVRISHSCKRFFEHPEILESILEAAKSTVTTALDIDSIDETSLCWNSDTNYLPSVTIDIVESYVKTRKQAAQAMQEKGYRIFASRRIASVATAKIDKLI